jgi:transposase
MLDESTRKTILSLHERGHGKRAIARALKVSRGAVRDVITSGTSDVEGLHRVEKAESHREEIEALYASCQGNLVRVHEELVAKGADISYPALTSFCRRHGLGGAPKVPAGRYVFEPGSEMQHDTSPHPAHIGGREQRVQIAGLALAFSRLSFIQLYPRFTRFECKVFLDEALDYVGGVCEVCMIDNTSVVVLRGTGADMVPVPEMAAYAEHRGFEFRAHEKGDANRSAVVEGLFDYVQNNFLAGRQFVDFDHVNREARAWCDKINATFSRKLHASRRELFAKEQLHLKPLPIWRPDVYRLFDRIVDLEGYVSIDGYRYSVPTALIGRRLEVRETKRELLVFDGPRQVATHRRQHDGPRRICLAEHVEERRRAQRQERVLAEERALRAELPDLDGYIVALRSHAPRGRAYVVLRRLRRMLRDYPRGPLLQALRDAAHYGLYDLERVEKMVLRNIQGDFFPLFGNEHDEDDSDDDEEWDDGR